MSYYYTTPDGRRLTQEEWNAERNRQIEEKIMAENRAQDEAARLVSELSEAYKKYAGFMASHPKLCQKVGDAEAQEHELYLKLRKNLERADNAPRCEKVREDGTMCGSPQMRGYAHCYAHERMFQVRPDKLQLPALDDANGIQLGIMMVQKALIDDEISEKKAGLLLYSLQIASSNAKWTTFTEKDKKVVTEMPVRPAVSTQQSVLSQGTTKNLPLINADENLPRIDADERGPKQAKRRNGRAGFLDPGSRDTAAERISHPQVIG